MARKAAMVAVADGCQSSQSGRNPPPRLASGSRPLLRALEFSGGTICGRYLHGWLASSTGTWCDPHAGIQPVGHVVPSLADRRLHAGNPFRRGALATSGQWIPEEHAVQVHVAVRFRFLPQETYRE